MKTTYKIFLLTAVFFCLSSCKKYLDIKPDAKLQLPSTLADCQALLADDTYMNNSFPYQGELGGDNLYLSFEVWNTQELNDREQYVWRSNADISAGAYSSAYRRILNANQVLETLNKISPSASDQAQWNSVKGSALFFRAYSLLSVAQIFCATYDATTAEQDLGLPIRLTTDISEVSDRGTVKQTYDRIIQDLKEAADLLPATPPNTIISKSTLLTKTAPLAALSRVYLSMRDYVNAGIYANECLEQYDVLMDYKQFTSTDGQPITQFNEEVIFDAQSNFALPMYYGRVDAELYQSYQTNDLRKSIFYQVNTDNSYTFKNGYAGTPGYLLFTGLATDEVYLTRAECYARAGNLNSAMKDLNTLLRSRYTAGFVDLTTADADNALNLILQERRKELAFRTIRWMDLRRLNKESRFAITLKRTLNGMDYTLPPNDLRYVLLLPSGLLSRVDLPQNPR